MSFAQKRDCGPNPAPVNGLARPDGSAYRKGMAADPPYRLDDQIGYVLRRVTQRHLAVFAAAIPEVTTTQFAVLARLAETGPLSQNQLGRAVAMDAATIKGVVDRLTRLALVATTADPDDRRRLTVALTTEGAGLYRKRVETALQVSRDTLAPLSSAEQSALMALLSRLT
jgi:DNA-binding MarR family transcriptional regulator